VSTKQEPNLLHCKNDGSFDMLKPHIFGSIHLYILMISAILSGCASTQILESSELPPVSVVDVDKETAKFNGQHISVSGFIVYQKYFAVLHEGVLRDEGADRPDCFGEGGKYLNIWIPYNKNFPKKNNLSGRKVVVSGDFTDGYTGEMWMHSPANNGFTNQNGPLIDAKLIQVDQGECNIALEN